VTTLPHAGHLLERARWAARAYADYDAVTVSAIVTAVADAGYAEAERLATAAVTETGMGIAADKVVKNRARSRGILDYYRGADFVSPRVDTARKIVEIPRPAGVVLAVTPATNPVCTVYSTVILALMTRNAVVVAPDPRAQNCSADAARTLADAAVKAGAPDGIVQVIDESSPSLVEALMADGRTDVVAATGVAGAGPGNVPVFVDASADIAAAARRIVDSKAFDNSVSCTNESVLVAEESITGALCSAMTRHGAHILDVDAARRLRAFMFADGHLNADVVGRDATWIAARAGLRVTPDTRVLVAPFEHVMAEEMLAHVKMSPVLGMTTVSDDARGIRAARAVVLIGGAGHSAAVHSENPSLITDFAAQMPVLRVSVNVGNSTGSAASDVSLQPQSLIGWTRIAYDSDVGVAMPNFAGITPWRTPGGPVPRYPHASNDQRTAPLPQRNGHSIGITEAPAGIEGHDH
jgi:acyl-CoA reductase-like NAD-dependent aldehyde dehydrogenase